MPLYLLNNGSRQIELDIDGVDVPISYSVADMKRPDKRRSSSSKTGKLKGTANNMRALRNIYNLSASNLEEQTGSFSFDPRVRVEAIYEEEGVALFVGLFQVLKAVKSNEAWVFEFVLFSNIVNIYNELQDLRVSDLDWSDYNHLLDKDTIRKSWDESVIRDGSAVSNFTAGVPDGFGYIYSWFDLGFNYPSNTPRRQRTNQITLGVYFREVMDKIMEFAGVDYEFTLRDSELWKRLTLFNEGGEIPKITLAEINLREVDKDEKINLEKQTEITNLASAFQNIERKRFSVGGFDWLSRYTDAVNQDDLQQVLPVSEPLRRIVIAKTGLYKISITGKYYLSAVVDDFDATQWEAGFPNQRRVQMALNRNGSVISTGIGFGTLPDPAASKQEIEVSISHEEEVFLNQGDEIDYRVIYNYSATLERDVSDTADPEDLTIYIESKTDFQDIKMEAIEADIQDGSDISLTRFLPKIKCSDFLLSVMRMFNLYQIEQDDGSVKFEPANDFYGGTDSQSTEDWSDLVDYSQDVDIEPPNRIEGKIYNLGFQQEDDFYNQQYSEEFGENYGEQNYQVSNTWQRGTNEIKLDFAQTIPVQILGVDVIMPNITKREDGAFVPYKGKAPRFFVFNGMIQVAQTEACSIHPSEAGVWGFDDLGGNPLYITASGNHVYPQFHHTLNLDEPEFDCNFRLPQKLYFNFNSITNDNFWSRYWRNFIEEITSADAKILTAHFMLNDYDISKIDFSSLKNIDGVVYRLNLISDYISGRNRTVMCELIKVIKAQNQFFRTINSTPTGFESNVIAVSGGDDNDDTSTDVEDGGITSEQTANINFG